MRARTMSHPWQFYAKVAALCFATGGAMEMFMIKTGFYDKVTQIEASRLEEARPEREAFLRQLRLDIEQQARERGVEVHFPDRGSPAADGPHQRS